MNSAEKHDVLSECHASNLVSGSFSPRSNRGWGIFCIVSYFVRFTSGEVSLRVATAFRTALNTGLPQKIALGWTIASKTSAAGWSVNLQPLAFLHSLADRGLLD
jgi:hypothetical protein